MRCHFALEWCQEDATQELLDSTIRATLAVSEVQVIESTKEAATLKGAQSQEKVRDDRVRNEEEVAIMSEVAPKGRPRIDQKEGE